ncbi:MAG: DUF5615 family PIN-like protein [Burkholderiales bacterium]
MDVGVGKGVEQWLGERGLDIKAARDIDPEMSDKDMLDLAVRESRMVITMDEDFGELVYNSGLPHAGVLLLRLEDASGPEKAKIIERIVNTHSDKLANKFCVFQNDRLRIRK